MLANLPTPGDSAFEGAVLVDGTWDNPNHWVRYALLRAALGLGGRETGILGPYHADDVARTFRCLGSRKVVRYADYRGDEGRARVEAQRLLAQTKDAREILQWELPGIPAHDLYDSLLKVQRHAAVDLRKPGVLEHVTEYLRYHEGAQRMLDAVKPTLLVASHTFSGRSLVGLLVWAAVRRGITVITPFGNFGTQRFARIHTPQDIVDSADSPNGRDLDALGEEQADALACIGKAYLESRVKGRMNDIAAQYAFRNEDGPGREEICAHFGWDPGRPIVAVYASTWFDAPHAYGMTRFRDYAEWVLATLEAAQRATHVSWLFRGHPIDTFFPGLTLEQMMPATLPTHVGVCPRNWSGGAVQRAADAVVTLQGTAGVEYAAAGKPVLLGDRSWYHDCGFARWSTSKEAYLRDLAGTWWETIDLAKAARRAQVFAGWYFCRPAWHEGFHLDDDSRQGELYEGIEGLFARYPHVVDREIHEIRDWYRSPELLYHTFKMRRATEYTLPTPTGT
jgi:hypothetical protein